LSSVVMHLVTADGLSEISWFLLHAFYPQSQFIYFILVQLVQLLHLMLQLGDLLVTKFELGR
jgi:hypothetical protein